MRPTPLVVLLSLGWTLACTGGREEPIPPVGAAPALSDGGEADMDSPPAGMEDGSGSAAGSADAPEVAALTKADLEGKTLRELSIMRNQPYADRGHIFGKAWLTDHFRGSGSYDPKHHISFSQLTPNEQANSKLIAEYETTMDADDLRARKADILAEKIEWEHLSEEYEIELQLLSKALGEWAGDPSVPLSERSPLEDPNVLDSEMSKSQLAHYSRAELRLVRNTIFARHGRAFKSPILQNYFATKVWYKVDPNYDNDRLTAADRSNSELIQKVEKEHGGAMDDDEHGEWLAMLAGA